MPPGKYAEAPATFVKRCAINPPVHDSATASDLPDFVSC